MLVCDITRCHFLSSRLSQSGLKEASSFKSLAQEICRTGKNKRNRKDKKVKKTRENNTSLQRNLRFKMLEMKSSRNFRNSISSFLTLSSLSGSNDSNGCRWGRSAYVLEAGLYSAAVTFTSSCPDIYNQSAQSASRSYAEL